MRTTTALTTVAVEGVVRLSYNSRFKSLRCVPLCMRVVLYAGGGGIAALLFSSGSCEVGVSLPPTLCDDDEAVTTYTSVLRC